MGSSNDELLRTIRYYQENLDRYTAQGSNSKLLSVVEKLRKLPITMTHLKDTGIGRSVNALRKLGGDVSEAAKSLVAKWKEMVQAEGDAQTEEAPNTTEEDVNTCEEEEDNHVDSRHSDGESSSHNLSDTEQESSDKHKIDVYSHSNNSRGSSHGHRSSKRHDRDSESSDDDSKRRDDSSGFESEDEEVHKRSKSKSHKRHHSESSEEDVREEKRHKSKKSKHSKESSDSEDAQRHHKSRSKSSRDESKSSRHESKSKSKEKTDSKKRDHHEDEKKSKHSKSRRDSDCEEKSSSKHRHSSKRGHESSSETEEAKRKSKHEKESSKTKDSKSHSSKSERHDKKEKKDGRTDESNEKHSHRREESHKHEEKRKSKDDKDEKKKEKGVSSSAGKSEGKSSTSKSSSSSEKKARDKEKVTSVKRASSEKILNGIGSESGASFAEALGMCGPVKLPTKPSSSTKKKPARASSPEKPTRSSSPEKQTSSGTSNTHDNVKENVPSLLKVQPSEPLNINIASLLPEITPNYRALGFSPDMQPKRTLTQDEALSQAISNKNMRTKVYSGNKSHGKVDTLFDMCLKILQDNIDALEYTGGVPYNILKPILDKATPDQLFNMEHYNPYLIEDTDELWRRHCQRQFRNKHREEYESWREMYMRCLEEREARLNAITANIKQSQDKSVPVRTTKLAYIDSVVKPPRDVARKQARNNIVIDKKPVQTPASRLSALATAGEAGKVAVPNPGPRAVERSSGGSSASAAMKPKKAPLMAKTLSLFKNSFRR